MARISGYRRPAATRTARLTATATSVTSSPDSRTPVPAVINEMREDAGIFIDLPLSQTAMPGESVRDDLLEQPHPVMAYLDERMLAFRESGKIRKVGP